MKTFFLTLALFFMTLLQGFSSSKVESQSESSAKWYRCGYVGFRPCARGFYWHGGVRYFGYPYGFGYRGCYRRCYRNHFCC